MTTKLYYVSFKIAESFTFVSFYVHCNNVTECINEAKKLIMQCDGERTFNIAVRCTRKMPLHSVRPYLRNIKYVRY